MAARKELLLVPICAGTIGLLSGFFAMAFRKGFTT